LHTGNNTLDGLDILFSPDVCNTARYVSVVAVPLVGNAFSIVTKDYNGKTTFTISGSIDALGNMAGKVVAPTDYPCSGGSLTWTAQRSTAP
jgi:hypothetical protein